MSKTFLLAVCCAGLALGGCSLAPEYRRPVAPVPSQWPAAPSGPAAPADAADLKWRDVLTDERLRQVVAKALENNRDLRLAALNVERARGMYGIQRGALYPSVEVQGAGGRQRRSEDLIQPGEPRTVGQYKVDLGIATWELDFFGRIRSLSEQALQEYLATDEARRGAQIALVAEVARTYLTLAADRELLKLAQATLESQQSAYQLVHKRYQVGVATELDLRRAETPLETARGDLARYGQQVAQDRNALDLLVGGPVPEEWLPADLRGVAPPQAVSAGLTSEVLFKRPDIMAAEHRLMGAYASIGAARAALFPRISLTSAVGTANNQLSGLFESGTGTWAFTPQFVMPIFDTRLWAALRVSKTDREIVLTQYEKTIQIAFREVADALAVQGAIDDQVAAQTALAAAVADTYRLATQRYEKGIDSYLGVLDAQRSHFAAQQGLVSLRLAKLSNQVRLYSVLGGGAE
ncbi:MAG: efflux transporter outer membrane subunit [Gallionellaceae bacterium]|nr:efflux transporter outer membrane subunit [Gallionellaceae bacterium]